MGEPPWRIRTVGSPAIDGLEEITALDAMGIGEITSDRLSELDAIFLMHPIGRDEAEEHIEASAALSALSGSNVLCLAPNSDAGRSGIARAIDEACGREPGFARADHITRPAFIGLLKHLATRHGVLVGNSSCGLIECAPIGLGVVDIGQRQAGRERARNVVHSPGVSENAIASAIRHAKARSGSRIAHPYGDGATGERVASVLADLDPGDPRWLRKRNAY
jgi:UDP-N-acetylglucosamine 2-epimerase